MWQNGKNCFTVEYLFTLFQQALADIIAHLMVSEKFCKAFSLIPEPLLDCLSSTVLLLY